MTAKGWIVTAIVSLIAGFILLKAEYSFFAKKGDAVESLSIKAKKVVEQIEPIKFENDSFIESDIGNLQTLFSVASKIYGSTERNAEYIKIIKLSLNEEKPGFAFTVAKQIYGTSERNGQYSNITDKSLKLKKYALAMKVAEQVYGSTERNTQYRKIIEGANSADLNPTLVELRNINISNCIGCYKCLRESKCNFQEDMTNIRNQINSAELMILASPLYWCGVTGLMKTLFDRLFFYYHPQNKSLISGKKAIIVTPMNQKNVDDESKILVDFYNRFLGCLGVKIINMFFFSDIMEKGTVLKKPEYLKQAYAIGTNLKDL